MVGEGTSGTLVKGAEERGSNPNSEGTYSTRNPALLVVSKPKIRPTTHLDPRSSGHLVEPDGSPARARTYVEGHQERLRPLPLLYPPPP